MSNTALDRSNRLRFVYDHSATGDFPPCKWGTEAQEYTLSVRHIPASVNRQTIIDFASQFGTLRAEPYVSQCTEKLRKVAFLTFTEESAVERCMGGDRDSYTLHGHPVLVQRLIPVGLTFAPCYRLLLTLETNPSTGPLSESDIRTYFETKYGKTKAFAWISESVANIDFLDYDAIDRAMLHSVFHTINGVKVRLEKVKSASVRAAYEQTIANGIKYCVHVQNVPPHVSGERLATIFASDVWNVLIRKGSSPERDPMEAWILDIPTMPDAEQLAASITDIDDAKIQCQAGTEPINEWTLCGGNRDGWCKHGQKCIYRHVTCASGDECKNDACSFSHSKQRKVVPFPSNKPAGPVDQQYRIRIDGLPYSMTAMELIVELKNQSPNLAKSIETPDVPKGSTTRHFYLVRQAAEKLARKRIFEWHNYPIRASYLVKCQLEYDRISVVDLSSNGAPTSMAAAQTNNQRLRAVFAPLSHGQDEIYGMPSKWVWTDRRLGTAITDVYLVYPVELADDRLGAMKVFRHQNELELKRAKRELLTLQALANDPAVVKVYQSNILDTARTNDQPLWIITELASELTLAGFVSKHKLAIHFHHVLRMTCQLLEIIQRCHIAHIIHRNLEPTNILVQQNNDSASIGQIRLMLIDFGAAWFAHPNLSITDQDDLKMLSHAKSSSKTTYANLEYLLSTKQRRSFTVDATRICYILFWMLTDQWPSGAPSAILPHRQQENRQKITNKLSHVQSNDHLREQVMHIFDRAFGPPDRWWSVDELLNHLHRINTLITELEIAKLNTLFPSVPITQPMPTNDLYARVVALIALVKQQFAQQYSTCMQWSVGSNRWSSKNKDKEVKNIDELIYEYQERRCTLSIVCSARLELDRATLFLGSVGSDETVDLKLLCSLEKETSDMDVSRCFDLAVKKLVQEKLERPPL